MQQDAEGSADDDDSLLDESGMQLCALHVVYMTRQNQWINKNMNIEVAAAYMHARTCTALRSLTQRKSLVICCDVLCALQGTDQTFVASKESVKLIFFGYTWIACTWIASRTVWLWLSCSCLQMRKMSWLLSVDKGMFLSQHEASYHVTLGGLRQYAR